MIHPLRIRRSLLATAILLKIQTIILSRSSSTVLYLNNYKRKEVITMPRAKGSKNKPKTVAADFATQIAEKQSAKEALTAEIASITANIDTLKADLKEKKTALKKAEKEVASLEAKKQRRLKQRLC